VVSRYEQQVPVIFGVGALNELSAAIKEYSAQKALLVCDAGVKAAGIAARVEAQMKDAGVDYAVFDKVLADAPVEVVDEGAYFGREQKIDIVIGVGGGSSMDTAKAIAIFRHFDPPSANCLVGEPRTYLPDIPVILVPTSAGTGSEATRMLVLSDAAANTKKAIFTRCSLAIVDPELTQS
jgi:alcohol dehydrogenase class IV